MDVSYIEKTLIGVLHELQKRSGQGPVGIDEKTRPIGDLAGFDSLNGLEATAEMSKRLGHELPTDFRPFVSESGRTASTVREIATRIHGVLGKGARVNG